MVILTASDTVSVIRTAIGTRTMEWECMIIITPTLATDLIMATDSVTACTPAFMAAGEDIMAGITADGLTTAMDTAVTEEYTMPTIPLLTAGGKGPALFHQTGIQVRESQVLQEGTHTQVLHRLHREGPLLLRVRQLRPVQGETLQLLQGRLTEQYRDRPEAQQALYQQADQLHQDLNTIIQEDHIPRVITTQGCQHVLLTTTAGQLKTPQ